MCCPDIVFMVCNDSDSSKWGNVWGRLLDNQKDTLIFATSTIVYNDHPEEPMEYQPVATAMIVVHHLCGYGAPADMSGVLTFK